MNARRLCFQKVVAQVFRVVLFGSFFVLCIPSIAKSAYVVKLIEKPELLPAGMGKNASRILFIDVNPSSDPTQKNYPDAIIVNGTAPIPTPTPQPDVTPPIPTPTPQPVYNEVRFGRKDQPIFKDNTAEVITLGSGPCFDAAVADVDNDGDKDIMLACEWYDRLWRNPGSTSGWSDGAAWERGPHKNKSTTASVTLTNVNNDGKPDAIIANADGVTVLLNETSPFDPNNNPNPVVTFTPYTSFMTAKPTKVAAADLDGDGDKDVNRDGTLGVGDQDGDGDGEIDEDIDLFFIKDGLPAEVWLNDGKGGFLPKSQNFAVASSRDVALSDLDGDTDLDAVIANYDTPSTIWFNKGGTFTQSAQSLGETSYGNRVTVGDLNGDDYPEIIIADDHQPARLKVWYNDGTGKFLPGQVFSAGHYSGVALGDVDADGDLDLMAVKRDGKPGHLWINYGELIVTLAPGQSIQDLRDKKFLEDVDIAMPLFTAGSGNMELKEQLGIAQTYLLAIADIKRLESVRTNLIGNVNACIYNQALWFDGQPSGYNATTQPNLRLVGMEEFWQKGAVNTSPTFLALLDTPVDLNHSALNIDSNRARDCEINCRNTYETKKCVCEDFDLNKRDAIASSHATHLAGIMAAIPNNGKIASIAGDRCKVIPVVVGDGNYASLASVFRAIEYIVDQVWDIKIFDIEYHRNTMRMAINLSLSAVLNPSEQEVFKKWISYAYQSYVPVVTSMGNTGGSEKRFPAAFDETIAVGAVDQQGQHWYLSNTGNWIDLVAPGDYIYSTVLNGGYGYLSGTSIAAAHVTGAVGLLLSEMASPDNSTIPTIMRMLKERARKSPNTLPGVYIVIKKSGSGRGTISAGNQLICDVACQEIKIARSEPFGITLHIVAEPGSRFVHWMNEKGNIINENYKCQPGETIYAVFEKTE